MDFDIFFFQIGLILIPEVITYQTSFVCALSLDMCTYV